MGCGLSSEESAPPQSQLSASNGPAAAAQSREGKGNEQLQPSAPSAPAEEPTAPAALPPPYEPGPIKDHIKTLGIDASTVQNSTAYGPSYMNDGTAAQFEDANTRIGKVIVFNDGKHIYGIQLESRRGIQGPRHMKSQGAFGYSVLELEPDEYITEVNGGEEDRGLVFIEIFTSKGKQKHYGGPEGSPFHVHIPAGYAVVGFHGHFNEVIKSLGVKSAPII